MATQYHQQAQAHVRPPPARRQPLGPGDARANMHPHPYPPHKQSSRRPVPPPAHAAHLPRNESLEKADDDDDDGGGGGGCSSNVRGSPDGSRDYKRVHDIKNGEEKSKRDSDISNASSTGERKRTIGQWQLGRTVGHGGCSTVRLVRHVVTGQIGAVKIISRKMAEQVRAQSLANLAESQDRSVQDLVAAGHMIAPPPPGLMREIAIMKLLDHPNIVRLYDVWENHNELYLVMEFVPGGELFHYVEMVKGLSEAESVYIFRQIIAALLYCHRMHIHHRDLKPENILLDRSTRSIKIVDFGMAAFQPVGKQLTTACGSPHYAAPEVIRSRPYDGAKADVWSCGVILYVMLTGTTPFNYDHPRNLSVMYAAIQAADYYMPPELSSQAKDLLTKIFVVRPEQRVSMDEIWDHPLMHKYDREFGYENEKKESWIGPVPTLDEWTVRRKQDIDKEILRNMRTLWHSVPEQTLIKKLLSSQLNQEKFFYAALAKHKEEHLENYTGGADALGYAASDYQHARPESGADPAQPRTQQTSQSSYSIMNNEHLRSSSIADGTHHPEPSQDPPRAGRAGATSRASSHAPRSVGHKRGNSGSMKAAALRVEMLKKANQQAFARQRAANAPADSTRSTSRTSLASSTFPSSPPVVVIVKNNSSHKRSVSFNHIRAAAGAAAQNAPSTRYTPTPEMAEQTEIILEESTEEDETSTVTSSPSKRVADDALKRKSKLPAGVTPRPRIRKADTPGAIIRTEVRKVSTELEKACEEAFFRSSYGSSAHTSMTERQSPDDTPPSSLSGQPGAPPLCTPTPRPLPAVPADTPNTFIAKTLEETRKKLVERSNGGAADVAKINEVLASLEKFMPAATDAERRTTSAPEPKSGADVAHLPIITEEPLPDTLRVGRGKGRGPRSFTAPGPAQQRSGQGKNQPDSIRVVDQSPANDPRGLPNKRNSSMEKEVIVNRPKTSDGTVPSDEGHLRVPGPYEQMLRKNSHDSAIGLRNAEDNNNNNNNNNSNNTQTSGAAASSADPAGREKYSWFRRWKKSPAAATETVASSSTEPHPGLPVQFKDLDDRKQKASIVRRDKQPPKPLDLSKPEPAPGPTSDGSEFPMRRVSDGEQKGFSRWLTKLGKKEEQPIRAIEIKDAPPSPGAPNPSTNHTNSGTSASQEPKVPSLTTAVTAQSWFSRFFRMAPPSHITCFSVTRGKARTEIYRLLRSFQDAGLHDLCYFPQENAITARVDKNNALAIRPVTFRVELFVVLQNGKRSGLSMARWTVLRGATSGFQRVVGEVESWLAGKGVLVEDEERKAELRAVLQYVDNGAKA